MSGTLLAFGVVNALALGGLSLAAVPIIIHWLSRRRFRRIDWAATLFLLEAERQNRRRLQVEQWLLLALRCLIMALLALLIARPFVRPGLVAQLLGGHGQTYCILLIDDSASLGHRAAVATDLERLSAAAGRLLAWLAQEAPDDRVAVHLTSQPEPLSPGETTLSPGALADLRAALGRLKPAETAARPGEALRRLAEELDARSATPATVYIFSDFQKSDWLGDGEGAAFGPLRSLPQPPRVVLVATGPEPRPNTAVIAVELERPQTVVGIPAVIQATVVNHGTRALENTVLQALLGDAPLPAIPLDPVAPGTRRVASFEATFAEEGFQTIQVGLGTPDALAADDVRRAVVRVKPEIRVLAVNGQPSADPLEDEVYLLVNALAPPGPFSSGIRVEQVDPDALEGVDLERFDVILLCNVPPLPGAAVDLLARFVLQGGGLGLYLGERAGTPDEFNAALGRLLPLPLESLEAAGDMVGGVQIVRGEEPALARLFAAGADLLSDQVRVRRYYRCTEQTPSGADEAADERRNVAILARFSDAARSPALIERKLGAGRVLLFPSTIDLAWNDWARAIDGSYVIAQLEIVQHLARTETHPQETQTGERLAVPLPPEAYEPHGLFKSPLYPDEPATEATFQGQELLPGQPAWMNGPRATRLGFYRLELARRTGPAETRPLATNLPPEESDLSVASRSELDLALGPVTHDYIPVAEEFLRGDETTRRELWPAILIVIVGLLLLEQTLAWGFGAARAPRARRA